MNMISNIKISQKWGWSKNEDNLKNRYGPNNENPLRWPKYDDNPKHKCDTKNRYDPKYINYLKKKNTTQKWRQHQTFKRAQKLRYENDPKN